MFDNTIKTGQAGCRKFITHLSYRARKIAGDFSDNCCRLGALAEVPRGDVKEGPKKDVAEETNYRCDITRRNFGLRSVSAKSSRLAPVSCLRSAFAFVRGPR